MATYKVLQDIEAEDKLIGPLSLRQFIYAIMVIVILFVAWQMARIQIFLGLPLLIPALFFGLLAAPLGAYQSSEIWLLGKIRFFIKPRRRIWDQSGIKQLVTITVPKKIEHQLTNNLSQVEVKSRLKALANTIDSRGWAIKNVNENLFAQPSYINNQTTDRLIDISSLPQEVASYDVSATEDILDEQNNPTAQHLDQMISTSTKTRRQDLLANMRNKSQPTTTQTQPDYWFMNQNPPAKTAPGSATFNNSTLVAPGTTSDTNPTTKADEQAILNQLHADHQRGSAAYGHMRTIRPADESTQYTVHSTQQKTKTNDSQQSNQGQATDNGGRTTGRTASDPAILGLANNDDLDVATIARQANKKRGQEPPDEVVVSLR